ncbi:hypothetical protein [Petroclostridium sp. X23]|uniref:hypothetical protein n=1 Tax=Petroclostridium sp. X23 TaxID=3045146 RepID=UPI0024AD1702|nr:hypothetical protein [Petroclostridium sp. X23]WHH57403.1 hypothetical protein QKW49_16390 [Petroclostridium sp. X23]
MNKEKLKTLILILLVVNSLVLTSRIWLNEKLWSNDYNFFANWRNVVVDVVPWLGQNMKEEASTDASSYLSLKIVVNYGNSNRVVYVNGQEVYDEYLNEISKIMEKLLKGETELKNQQSQLKDEWVNALKQKSLLIDLDTPYRMKHMAQFLGIKETPLSGYIKEAKELIIVPGDTISGSITVLVRNAQDGSVFKCYLNYDKSNINRLMEQYAASAAVNHRFSYELGMDKIVNEKIIVDSFVLFPFSKQKINVLGGINPIHDENDVKSILRAFKYSTNNLRKYTEIDDTVVYVENDSTLKIHPNGFIEYDAVQEGKGLLLNNLSAAGESILPTFRQSLEMALDFMSYIEKTHDIKLSSVIEDPNKSGSYKFIFNYYFEGLQIRVKLDDVKARDAVVIEMVNGRLKSYRHYARDYQIVKETDVGLPVSYVMDNIINMMSESQGQVKISDLFLEYEESGSQELLEPYWGVRIEGSKDIFKIPVGK